MKNCKYMMLITIVLTILTCSTALAQINGAADTSKEGSLLIWPSVQTNKGNETYIVINNSSPSSVFVKCFWEVKDVPADPTSQVLFYDFVIQLGGLSPVVFRASDGSSLDDLGVAAGMGSSEQGALKCWAVDETLRKQISWNHLSGSAIIVRGDSTSSETPASTTGAWQYSAWRFAANIIESSGVFADGFWVGPVLDVSGNPNTLNLKASPTTVVDPSTCPAPYKASACSLPNAAYDACPKYLTFNFLTEPNAATKTDGYAFNNLAIVPCKTDLTDITLNTRTQLAYTVWNEKSVQYAGLNKCANCAYSTDLGNLWVLRSRKLFQRRTLKTPVGHFRVEGKDNSSCGADAVATPLLGVLFSKIVGSEDLVAMNGSTNGKETTDWGYITWNPTGLYYQSMLVGTAPSKRVVLRVIP